MFDNLTIGHSEADETAAAARFGKLSSADLATLRTLLKGSPHEAGIDADRWSPRRISTLLSREYNLNYSPKHAVRLLRGHGLRISFKRAREPRLKSADIAKLRTLLKHPPAELGLGEDTWSRVQLAQLIETQFQVRYSPQYAARLVRILGLKLTMTRRKRRLQQAQVLELKTLLASDPKDAGVAADRWSPSSIARLVFERFGVCYHPRSISRVLRRWHIEPPSAPSAKYSVSFSHEELEELRAVLGRTPREAGIPGQVWTRRQIAAFLERRFNLRYSACTLDRLLRHLNVRATHRATRGGVSRLNREQGQKLAQAIHPDWTRKQVVRFIRQTFQIDYAPTSVPRLLRRLGIRPAVKPEPRPALPGRPANPSYI